MKLPSGKTLTFAAFVLISLLVIVWFALFGEHWIITGQLVK